MTRRCTNHEKCLKYTEMTLDWTAHICYNCPAYEETLPDGLDYPVYPSKKDEGL